MGIFLNSTSPCKKYQAVVTDTYFVDKTALIEELIPALGKEKRFFCITRPRRFGKTVMANMTASFFGKGADSSALFDKLKIAQSKHYREHLNQHRVIYIDFSEIPRNCKDYQQYILRIEEGLIRDLTEAYPELEIFQEEAVWDILTRIFEKTGHTFIFVMDEWDAVFHMPFITEEAQKQYLLFLKALLKSKAYVELAYMTGILPIAKYSGGSELNMFLEYNIATKKRFSGYFGFLDQEVDALFDIYQKKTKEPQITREGLRLWYDGYYTVTGERLYNPRSVVYALADDQLSGYWTDSGPYDEIYYYIKDNVADVRDDLAWMVSGERVEAKMQQYAATAKELKTKDQIYSAMVVYGLLTYKDGEVMIPNKELMDKFDELLLTNDSLGYVHNLAKHSSRMLKATLAGDRKYFLEEKDMASFSRIENFQVKTNQAFLDKAAALEPVLNKRVIRPMRIITVEQNQYHEAIVHEAAEMSELPKMSFGKGDKVIFDFGDHQVGYVSFTAVPVGSHYDAPAYLRLKFAEIPSELLEDAEDYDGWLSRSWIQEDSLHLDILPSAVHLPRRYAFRYMQIEVLDTSPKYSLTLRNIYCDYVSAVEMNVVEPLNSDDDLLNRMDRVSIKTLMDCMQSVFEDGVKRDRRLWLGDLRLQARANYETFRNYDMVKRCLYLFAGMTFDDGRIGACFFHEPDLRVDDTYLMDYALLFGPALCDYYEASQDLETLKELYPQAMEQIDICWETMLDERHVVIDKGDDFWCFLDWGEGLNKQAGAQAVLIYTMRYAIRMANVLGDQERVQKTEEQMELLKAAALEYFWDEKQKLFVSGEMRQVSWATQVWMILARVFDKEKSRELVLRTMQVNPRIRMVTPYMYHHYMDALIRCGEEELALEEMKRYWGEMILDGADTFWELYNPYNKHESPYGSSMVNSYCHAWSCTPTYLLRKFYKKNGKLKEKI